MQHEQIDIQDALAAITSVFGPVWVLPTDQAVLPTAPELPAAAA